jgi:hypothetical protein
MEESGHDFGPKVEQWSEEMLRLAGDLKQADQNVSREKSRLHGHRQDLQRRAE